MSLVAAQGVVQGWAKQADTNGQPSLHSIFLLEHAHLIGPQTRPELLKMALPFCS